MIRDEALGRLGRVAPPRAVLLRSWKVQFRGLLRTEVIRQMRLILIVLAAMAAPAWCDSRNQTFDDFTLPLPLKPGETLVIGIVGGWDRWDNPQRITRRIALDIRDAGLSGVFVETVENHKIELADQLIRRAFPDPVTTRVVIFGQSLGGREVVRLCRRLNETGVPVLLAVVIDAVGNEDYTITPNVRAAANLFQRDSYWPIVGAKETRAADPDRTTILGNWQYHYDYRHWEGKVIEKPDFEEGLRWRWMGGHLRMEYDPEVWKRVRELITDAVAAAPPP